MTADLAIEQRFDVGAVAVRERPEEVAPRPQGCRCGRGRMTMPIENYHGKSSLETAALVALIAGDKPAAEEGLNRLNRAELNMLAEVANELSEMAWAKVPQ